MFLEKVGSKRQNGRRPWFSHLRRSVALLLLLTLGFYWSTRPPSRSGVIVGEVPEMVDNDDYSKDITGYTGTFGP